MLAAEYHAIAALVALSHAMSQFLSRNHVAVRDVLDF